MISGFAAAMDRLAADPDLRRAMGEAGRTRILQDYSWDAKVEVMLGIYSSTANLRPSAPTSYRLLLSAISLQA